MTRKPSTDSLRTERLELRLTPAEVAAWRTLATEHGYGTVAEMVRAAVEAYGQDSDKMADLGREVMRLARRHR